MSNEKTLVIGAGASHEVKLPTGNDLKREIASMLDIRFDHGNRGPSGDHYVYAALSDGRTMHELNSYLHAAWRIRNAMPLAISIDNFIDNHQGDDKVELCGKLAIVRAILNAERNSLLFISPTDRLKFQDLEETWFNSFMQLLTENCTLGQLEERLSSVSLIIFNYDRCVEQFLYLALQTYYDIDERDAASLVKGINIYHPYGTIGSLPWYGQSDSIEFGAEALPTQLLSLVTQVKTFTEGTNPSLSDVMNIRTRIPQSEIVMFLGFAFHRINLQFLYPYGVSARANSSKARIYATAKGISTSDCAVVSSELTILDGVIHENVTIRNDLTCAQLFKEYWRSLSFT